MPLVSNAAPQMGTVKLTLFRPAGPPFVEVPALVPIGAVGPALFDGP